MTTRPSPLRCAAVFAVVVQQSNSIRHRRHAGRRRRLRRRNNRCRRHAAWPNSEFPPAPPSPRLPALPGSSRLPRRCRRPSAFLRRPAASRTRTTGARQPGHARLRRAPATEEGGAARPHRRQGLARHVHWHGAGPLHLAVGPPRRPAGNACLTPHSVRPRGPPLPSPPAYEVPGCRRASIALAARPIAADPGLREPGPEALTRA